MKKKIIEIGKVDNILQNDVFTMYRQKPTQ